MRDPLVPGESTEQGPPGGTPGLFGRQRGSLILLLAARVSMSATRAATGIIVPIYLARLGFSAVSLGVLFTVVAVVSGTQSVLIGLYADRVGRKPFVIAVPLVTAAATAAFTAGTGAPLIFITAAVGSFGRGSGAGGGTVGPYQPAEQALIAALVPAARRTSVFGAFASASAAGALLGSLLALLPLAGAGLGLSGPATDRFALLVVAGFAALAGVLAVWVREPQRPPTSGRPALSMPVRSRPLLYRLGLINAVNGIGVGLFGPFVTYWFFIKFGVGTTELGLLFAVVNGATIATNLGAGWFARRRGLVRGVVWMRIVQALLLVPLALAPAFLAAGSIYLARAVVQRLGMSLRQSFVMGAADPQERASVAALSRIPSQVAGAAVPPLTGYLFDSVSLAMPFVVAAAFQLVYALLFQRFFGRMALPEERAPSRKDSGRG